MKKYIYQTIRTIAILLSLAFISTCAGNNHVLKHENYNHSNILVIPIVFHVRNKDDILIRIPKYWLTHSEPLFLDGNIKPVIVGIRYDVPNLKPDIKNKKEMSKFFDKSNDGSIHIFFVENIKDKGKETLYNGVHEYKNMCESFILIQDKTEIKTMAHEIGHYLGLDHFYKSELNVMNDKNRSKKARFSKDQIKTMRQGILNQYLFCKMPRMANSHLQIDLFVQELAQMQFRKMEEQPS